MLLGSIILLEVEHCTSRATSLHESSPQPQPDALAKFCCSVCQCRAQSIYQEDTRPRLQPVETRVTSTPRHQTTVAETDGIRIVQEGLDCDCLGVWCWWGFGTGKSPSLHVSNNESQSWQLRAGICSGAPVTKSTQHRASLALRVPGSWRPACSKVDCIFGRPRRQIPHQP